MRKSISNKFVLFTCMFVLVCGLLVACGNTDEQKNNESKQEEKTSNDTFPLTVTDDAGNEVTIEAKPEKIVSLLPSTTETLFALGLDEEIVGVSDFDNYPEAALDKEKVGGIEINVEKVISLQPDVLFVQQTHADNYGDVIAQLEGLGIAVLVVNTEESFEDAYESIKLLAKVTGTSEKGTKMVQNMKDELEAIQEKAKAVTEKKRVWVEVSAPPELYTAGNGTFINEMLELIGAENIVASKDGWFTISEEEVVKLNPDVVIITYGEYEEDAPGDALSRPGWQEVAAVKNKQVYEVNGDSVTRPGPRLVMGVEELAKAIYPDVFQ